MPTFAPAIAILAFLLAPQVSFGVLPDPNQKSTLQSQVNGAVNLGTKSTKNNQGQNYDPNYDRNLQNSLNRDMTTSLNPRTVTGGTTTTGGAGKQTSVIGLAVDFIDLFTGDYANFGQALWEFIKNDIFPTLAGKVLSTQSGSSSLWTQIQQAANLTGADKYINIDGSQYNCPTGNCGSTASNPNASSRNLMTNQGMNQFSTSMGQQVRQTTNYPGAR